jgi:methylase of polypeptide subunit release factors
VARTLDLGTGSGVQALHATRHSGRVVATDVSARALAMAALTTALSGVEVELRRGSFLEPVAGEQFDLVVSNPPFVVSPGRRHSYRDGGLPLDGVTALLAGESPRHLAAGGTAALLGNWVHRRGEPWEERVAGWLPGDGFDALVVQRETQDPAAYVATWLRDSGDAGGPGYRERYDEWLGALEHAGVEAVGFGTVSVRRTDAAARTEVLDWPHAVEQPLGPHVDALFSRWAWLRSHLPATELAAARLRLSDGVVQEQWGQPGAEHPARLVLRQQHGLRRAVECDTALAALAGACDGSVAVGPLVAAVASVLGTEPGEAARVLLPQVRRLLAEGFLEPAGGTFPTSPSGHLPV